MTSMAGRRVAHNSSERNSALLILGFGSAAALASLFGNIWVVRAGVVVAVVMAAVALSVAFAQIKRIREEHNAALHHEVELRMAQSDQHHADSVAMIERFAARTDNLKAIIAKQRSQLGAAKAELSSMRGNAAWLRAEIAERQTRVDELTARLEALEAEKLAEDTEDSIVEMPETAMYPQVDDIWGDDEHPTLIDLRKLNLDEEFEMPLRKHA